MGWYRQGRMSHLYSIPDSVTEISVEYIQSSDEEGQKASIFMHRDSISCYTYGKKNLNSFTESRSHNTTSSQRHVKYAGDADGREWVTQWDCPFPHHIWIFWTNIFSIYSDIYGDFSFHPDIAVLSFFPRPITLKKMKFYLHFIFIIAFYLHSQTTSSFFLEVHFRNLLYQRRQEK